MQAQPDKTKKRAVVIGSGFGGLAIALRLQVRGYQVSLVERLPQLGGRARRFEEKGFTFDAGPTVITAPFLLEELWELCGKRMADDVDLRPVTPFYRIRFGDGTWFDYTGDAAAMRAEVERLSPKDVAGYERFVELSRKIFDVGFSQLAHKPFDDWRTMARIVPQMLRLHSYRTVYGLVRQYIKDPRLRQAFSFHPLLVGGNPFTTSSIYALILYLERHWGVHFPIGGTFSLVEGLANLLVGQGGTVRCSAPVEEILTEGRRATGVRLANGECLPADVVVANSDVAWTYRNLLPSVRRQHWTDKRLARQKYSMSLFVWYFGTDRTYDDVAHHTILLGPRYRALLDDIFKNFRLADDFSLYLHRSTATDPQLAPPGGDAFYVLAPVPHLDSGTQWPEVQESYRKRLEDFLAATCLPQLGDHLVVSRLLTPQDFHDELWSYKGAAFGMQPTLAQSAYFRPHNRSEEIEGLYFVGAGTHPGAGLPGVLSSARVVDGLVPAADGVAADIGADSDPPPGAGRPRLPAARLAPSVARVCEASLRQGSRSFFLASRLLPRRLRGPAAAIYAFCREADDLIDQPSVGSCSGEEPLQVLRSRLDRLYAKQDLRGPVDLALAEVIDVYALPRSLFEALLEGFAWDRTGASYDRLDQVQAYAARVAGSVGVLMAMLMGERRPDVLARAADLGVAMQLTNIARDVGEDAAAGRLYLPRDWLREKGLDPVQFLAQPQTSAGLAQVVHRLLDEGDVLYRRAEVGICALPADCRSAIYAARLIYSRIGYRVRSHGERLLLQKRAIVPWYTKLGLLLRSRLAWLWRPRPNPWPALPAAAFLLTAQPPAEPS
jgi:phytoene desaturase